MPDFAAPPYRIYVLAGTATQAADYMRVHGLMPSQVVYVTGPDKLLGLLDPEYAVVGTFWDRHDAIQIWEGLLIACRAGSPRPKAPDHIEKFLDKKYNWTPTASPTVPKKEPVLPSKFKRIKPPDPPPPPPKPENFGFKRIKP